MSIIDNLKQLVDIPGISGREELVREYIIEKIKSHADYYTDPLGNLIVDKKGSKIAKNKVMLSAHMDEIGFIITNITDDGLLRFATVGGIDGSVIFGKSVEVGSNRIYGVIGGAPVHLTEKDKLLITPKIEDLYIDIGAKDKKDAELHISIGDFAVFYAPFVTLAKKTILGKAFDDRVGCALMIDMICSDLEYGATFAFTVQEEVGCVGGKTASYTIEPRFGVIVESTTASDIAGVSKDDHVCTQGGGPVISFMDRGTLYDKKLYDLTLNTAKKANVPHQSKLKVAGGNEARMVQTSKAGAGVIAISLPTRYIHSPSNSVNIDDIESTLKLLNLILVELAELD